MRPSGLWCSKALLLVVALLLVANVDEVDSIQVEPAIGAYGTNLTWAEWYDESRNVIAQEDLPLRNLQISYAYHEVGRLLQGLLNTNQANWLTYATWASNSVGLSIRDETLNYLLQELLQQYLPAWVLKLLETFPDLADKILQQMLSQTSQYLSEGNVFVFSEIATAIIKFGGTFETITDLNEAQQALGPFIADNLNVTTQLQLIRSIEMYWQVKYNTSLSDSDRAQKLLLANALAGYQEQIHLQYYILKSFPGNLTINITSNLHFAIDVDPIVTKMMLTLVTSNEILWMADDVPPLEGTDFPQELSVLTDSELIELYLPIVGQTTSLQNTGADNWISFGQRMKYIMPLFRSRQMDQSLWTCSPFSVYQTQEIISNQMPDSDFCIATCCKN